MQPVIVAASPPELISAFGLGAVVLNCEIGGDLEHRRVRFRAVQIDQFDDLCAFPGILAGNGQIYLKVGGIPELVSDGERMVVSDGTALIVRVSRVTTTLRSSSVLFPRLSRVR